MTRCPSWEPPTPTPSDTSGAGGARTDKARGAKSVPVRSCTQSPSPSPRFPSSSLGFVVPRVSDAPFGGRRDGPTPSQRCPLLRISASSSPPLATDPTGSSARAWGAREHPVYPGPLRPREADSGLASEAQLRPAGPPPAQGRTPIPTAVGSDPDQPHRQATG